MRGGRRGTKIAFRPQMNIRSALAPDAERERLGESPNALLQIPVHEYEEVRPLLERVPVNPSDFCAGGGQPLSHVYFPYSGVISLIARMKNGETAEVATVGRYGMVGVSVLLDADPAPYHMVCQVPGSAARMPVHEFTRVVERLPRFRHRLQHYALYLFHEAARTAACNRLHTVEQRLARWLLLCSDQAGLDVYALTHEALARILGTGRPYVTRTARELQLDGLVQYRHGILRILDLKGLEQRACEDYHATKQQYSKLLDSRRSGFCVAFSTADYVRTAS